MKQPWYVKLAMKINRYHPRNVKVLSDRFVNQPYLVRITLLDLGVIKVYLHQFIRRDYEAKFHDHPWPFFHYVLCGGYHEASGEWTHDRQAGYWAFHRARYRHSIVALTHEKTWTLIVRGPTMRDWGFHCDEGYISHDEYHKRRQLGLGWEC